MATSRPRIKREEIPFHIADTIVQFNAALRESIFTDGAEQAELALVDLFFQALPHHSVADHIVKYVVPHADKIRSRDVGFFLDNKHIFAGLPESRVDHYSSAFRTKGRIAEEDMATIWQYFDNLVILGRMWRAGAAKPVTK